MTRLLDDLHVLASTTKVQAFLAVFLKYQRHSIASQKMPIVLYVGKTTSKRSIKERLYDHFGGSKANYQGSQFRKFLYQVIQEKAAVKKILWSNDTLVACVPIEEADDVIDSVERLAIQVFQPRFNIKASCLSSKSA